LIFSNDYCKFVACRKIVINLGAHWRQSLIQHGQLCRPCCCGPYTLATKFERTSNIRATQLTVSATQLTSWRQSRLRQTVKFKFLPICCQNRQQIQMYTATVDFVAGFDFQQSLLCWIQFCRQCV